MLICGEDGPGGGQDLHRTEKLKKLELPYTLLEIFNHTGVLGRQRLEPDSVSVLDHLSGELSSHRILWGKI